ncbi:fused MFS/spermidine synthase [Sphingomonas sp. ID1715]|uniref:spermidine synthase n=1 Tax=Sphingomonas sp. ID1715 TaxID=1656898 RepID=UPI0014896407|nr:fused MFS/spermidine synthase [Sphingomonas sp. ID1715]NNM77957.1 fused MFS/spermidine synthase [Sphingomonas sp. ID1715]
MASAAGALTAEGIGEHRRDLGPLFVGTIFVGSFLLFLVQPMIARMALPRLGGAPAVWNSAMLVYQALLLGGYAYAHGLSRLNVRNQSVVHLLLLASAALLLPIGLVDWTPSATASPALWILWLLLVSIGPLFLAVAAQAPMIQRWYAAATGGRDPYPLYAASNLGSFTGLLSYPLLVEPRLTLAQQSTLWTIGYVLLFVLTLSCAAVLPRAGVDTSDAGYTAERRPTLRRRLWWIMLAAVPSGLMLSTTTYLTTDIVAMPMLWVIPLGLYLLSFTLAFAAERGAVVSLCRLSPLIILAFGGMAIRHAPSQPFFMASVELLLLFTIAVTLHAEMYRTRPAPIYLTGFYLCMSIGGALGGLFSGLLAPVLFDWTYEHPLLILAAAALVPQHYLFDALDRLWSNRTRAVVLTLAMLVLTIILVGITIEQPWRWMWGRSMWIGGGAIGLLTFFCIGRRVPFLTGIAGMMLVFGGYESLRLSMTPDARARSYFGVYTIRDSGDVRTLAHGTTAHGVQLLTPGRERELTSYYSAFSGVGQAMFKLPEIAGPAARVGSVGLGTGTLACYTRPGQSWRIYEIDPVVIDIARRSGKFTYLPRCNPRAQIILGDARVSLAKEPAQSLDFLSLDAFSSDAVPMHLLTREAFAIYGRVLAPRGMLLVHISNRFLELEPVIARAAREGGWLAARYDDLISPTSEYYDYINSSSWILMTRDAAVLARVTGDPPPQHKWRPLKEDAGFTGWSDDYGSILPLLKAFR